MVDDRGVDDDPRLELLLHRAPLALEAGAAEREDDMALGRLRLQDVDEDDIADRDLRLRLPVAPKELAVADHALRLGADVDEDLVLVDTDNGPFDHVAMLEALDVRVLLGEQLLHRGRLGTGPSDGGRGRFVLRLGVRGRGSLGCLVLGNQVRDGRRVGCLLRGGGRGLGGGLGNGGLVGDGDGRDGLFGRRSVDGGCGLRRRRGPALLLVGQGDPVSYRGFDRQESRTAAGAHPGPSGRELDRW